MELLLRLEVLSEEVFHLLGCCCHILLREAVVLGGKDGHLKLNQRSKRR